MPKGNPSKQTIATEKYQKKAGYKVKGFKLKGDVTERFAAACERAGVSQAEKSPNLWKSSYLKFEPVEGHSPIRMSLFNKQVFILGNYLF